MNKLLGFLCAVLLARNAGAAITGWTGDLTGAGPDLGTLAKTISESTAVGTSLFKIGATTDAASVTLTLDSTVPSGKATYANGVVTLSALVDFETASTLKVLIKAVDLASPAVTATATVTIKVTDEPASSDAVYAFCLADPTAAGTAIATAKTAVSGAVWTVEPSVDDAASFEITTAGALKAKLDLKSSTKVYYKANLVLTSGSETSKWPLHVLVDNECVSTGTVPIISAMALLLSLMVSQLL